jgi:hypothetical protein
LVDRDLEKEMKDGCYFCSHLLCGFIKGLRTENTGIAPLKDSTGMTQSDSSKKADILNCQFSSVFNKDEQCDSIPNKGPSPFNDMPAIV